MKDGSKFARKGILDIAPYVPGKPVEEVEREYGVTNAIKMASNENPLHTSPRALEAMRSEAANCYMYPEASSPMVRDMLAGALGLESGNILCGTGGDHVILMMCQAFVNQGDEVIVGTPSFSTYTLSAQIMGGTLVKVPLVDHTFDLDAILAAVTPRTKLIFFCNPNNPTGTMVGRAKVESFLAQLPDHVITVFDEAYCEYVTDPDYPDGVDYVKQERNVIVIRTFSKIYGLAGNRIGYAIAPRFLMDVLSRVMPAFPINRLAQAAAVAAYGDTAFVNEVRRVNSEGIRYLYQAFDELGMAYAPTFANYIWVDTGMDSSHVCEQLLRRGIIVRNGASWGYPTTLRITIGTMDENKRCVAALKELQQG